MWILLFLIPLFIAFFWLFKHLIFKHYLLDNFKRCNVIVFGKKGSGKDLVFQYVIKNRKKPYYANIPYGYDYHSISLLDVSCMPNTYKTFVENNITQTNHKLVEGANIYVSDIGIFLPSYIDNKLYNYFPSMPIFYALSRHLYNTNVHCNTQSLSRCWKALREQADFYVCAKHTKKFCGFLFTRVITYDKYESALNGLMPLKSRFMNKFSKAESDKYSCENGVIKSGLVINRVKKIKYDTRYFEKVVFNDERITSFSKA